MSAPSPLQSARALARAAGLPDAAVLTPLTGGVSAQTWSARLPDEPAPRAVIKRTQQFAPRALAEAAALSAAHAVPGLPRLLHVDATPPVSGLVMSWIGDAPLGLDAWLAGATSEAARQVAHDLGARLAQLHEVVITADSGVKRADDPMPWGYRQQHQLERAVRRARKRIDHPHVVTLLDRALAHVTAQLPVLVGDARPMRLIHRDLRPANALVHTRGADADRLAGIIDLERACAGDPAWDLVKLRWWLITPYPALAEPLRAGYTTARPWPDPARVDLYEIIEAASLLATFHGAHASYPALALDALRRAGLAEGIDQAPY